MALAKVLATCVQHQVCEWAKVCFAGCLPLLATLIGDSKIVAEPVVLIIFRLLTTQHLSAATRANVKKLLAQMQGMRRCSIMLCPLLPFGMLERLSGTAAAICDV